MHGGTPQLGQPPNHQIMLWLNLDTSIATRPEFFRSPPLDRATWLALMFYCAVNENSGRIIGARLWGDDTWQQGARLRQREVIRSCPLWKWDGDDLLVAYYPVSQEEKVRRRRGAGKAGADARWGKNQPIPEVSDADANGNRMTGCNAIGGNAAHGESNVIEGNVRERNVSGGRLPLWRQLKALEDELDEVKSKLQALPRPDPQVFPEDFQKVQLAAAPLRARRDELKRLIAEIQKQQEP